MDGHTPTVKREGNSVWKRLMLPTVLTIAIGSMYARSTMAVGSGWEVIGSAPVQLDSKLWHTYDNQDGAVAKLGIEPGYFLSYSSPDGQEHWIPLANKKGSETTKTGLPTVDPAKRSVRYVVILKNHRRLSFDETKNAVMEGNEVHEGKAVHFKALMVPREGVTTEFHPADVERVELQVRAKR